MIGQALGQVLSQAVGIAISPVPIILVIVVMFSRRALVNAGAILVGWALGVAIPLVIALGDRAQTVLESWQEWLAPQQRHRDAGAVRGAGGQDARRRHRHPERA